ncbi:MAG: DUF3015 domain-containing protein [Deltaproteobacteria bacterium]|nr:DUF3015 domain-containing protein [Deltaproteobacteria bacterium]
MKKSIITFALLFFTSTSGYAVYHEWDNPFWLTTSSSLNATYAPTYLIEGTTKGTESTTYKIKRIGKDNDINHKVYKKFISDNYDNLAIDIAKGSGEYLEALAEIVKISHYNRKTMFSELKRNYHNIYISPDKDPKYVTKRISHYILKE